MRVLFIQEEFCIRALKQAAALTHNGVEVYALSPKIPGSFYGLEEAKSWFKQYATGPLNTKTIKSTCKKWNIDVIHSHNWPDTYTLEAIRANCCPVVHDTHDLQSLVVEDMKATFPTHHAQAERDSNTLSSARIYVTKHMAEIVEKKYKVSSKMLILPCLSSLAFKPSTILPKMSLSNNKINIVYQGGLADARGKNHSYYMYDVIKKIASDSSFEVYIYMSNADPKVIAYYSQIGTNVHIKGKVSPFELATEITQYDYGLALFNINMANSDCLATGFANKFGDYILSGVPPIVDVRTPEMYKFLQDHACGIYEENLDACISKMKSTPRLQVNEEIINLLTYESCFHEILQIYKDVTLG